MEVASVFNTSPNFIHRSELVKLIAKQKQKKKKKKKKRNQVYGL